MLACKGTGKTIYTGLGEARQGPVVFIELSSMQTSEKEMLQKEQKGKGLDKYVSEEVLYKIDIPANRYDMLCLEGIARALNIFNKRISRIEYRLANMQGAEPHTLPVTHAQVLYCLIKATQLQLMADGCCKTRNRQYLSIQIAAWCHRA